MQADSAQYGAGCLVATGRRSAIKQLLRYRLFEGRTLALAEVQVNRSTLPLPRRQRALTAPSASTCAPRARAAGQVRHDHAGDADLQQLAVQREVVRALLGQAGARCSKVCRAFGSGMCSRWCGSAKAAERRRIHCAGLRAPLRQFPVVAGEKQKGVLVRRTSSPMNINGIIGDISNNVVAACSACGEPVDAGVRRRRGCRSGRGSARTATKALGGKSAGFAACVAMARGLALKDKTLTQAACQFGRWGLARSRRNRRRFRRSATRAGRYGRRRSIGRRSRASSRLA